MPLLLDEYVTVTQAAAAVGFSRKWIRELAARGKIPSTRKARLILVHLPSLVAYRAEMAAMGTRKNVPYQSRSAQPQERADG